MKVRARTERNFRRARIDPARRRRLRAALSWPLVRRCVSVLLLAFGIQQAVTFAFTTSLLRIDRITVQGNVRLSSGEVQALVEDLRGTNILRADLGATRERLAASPWVADVALRRVLPRTIQVFVAERQPIGLCRLGRELYLMDETGTLLDHYGPQYAEFDLPIIDGVADAPQGADAPINRRRVELAARVIASFARSPDAAVRLSQVDVSDPQDAVVLLENDPALLHLGTERFFERVQAYLELADAFREHVPDMDHVDLRFDRLVPVRPAPEAARTRRREPARGPVTRQF